MFRFPRRSITSKAAEGIRFACTRASIRCSVRLEAVRTDRIFCDRRLRTRGAFPAKRAAKFFPRNISHECANGRKCARAPSRCSTKSVGINGRRILFKNVQQPCSRTLALASAAIEEFVIDHYRAPRLCLSASLSACLLTLCLNTVCLPVFVFACSRSVCLGLLSDADTPAWSNSSFKRRETLPLHKT